MGISLSNIRRTARQCFGSQVKKMHEPKHAIPFSFLNAKYTFEILWSFNKTWVSAIKSKSKGMDQSNMIKIYELHSPTRSVFAPSQDSCLTIWNYGTVQIRHFFDLQPSDSSCDKTHVPKRYNILWDLIKLRTSTSFSSWSIN